MSKTKKYILKGADRSNNMSKTKKKYLQKKADRLTKGFLQRGEKGNLIIKIH